MASVNRRPQPPNSMSSKGSNPPSSPRPSSSSRHTPAGLTAKGLGLSPSLRGPNGTSRPARANMKPNTSFLNTNANVSDEASDDDARAENNALMDELRERVQKAELASEEYQRQLGILQARLGESMQEQVKLEDRVHENEAKANQLEDEKVVFLRQKREMERQIESERTVMMQDRAQQKAREVEQQSVVQRLKETLAQRELKASSEDDKGLSRSCTYSLRSSFVWSADIFQRALEANLPLTRRTGTLHHRLPSNVTTLSTTPSSSCKRTESSSRYASN